MPPSASRIYVFFAVFRLLNALLIQSQFDPDEYWQNLEPAYCYVFGKPGIPCEGLTWEWKRRAPSSSSLTVESIHDLIKVGLEGPVRSYVAILPTLIFYYALKVLAWDTTFLVAKGPMFLNAVLVAAPTDWAVWYMAKWMDSSSKDPRRGSLSNWCAFCSLTSWFWAYAQIRTYSNSLEAALLAISLVLVAKEFLGGQFDDDNSRYSRARLAFFLGGVSCSIRFTCLAAYVPMGILLASKESSVLYFVNYIASICALPGFFGLLSTILLDKFFYGFWAVPFLGNIHFNVILGNGSLYGTHPIHWYLTAGIPAITGVMLPFLIVSFCSRWTFGERNLWVVAISYILAHSYSEHKEFRFMLPLLPVFCLIAGNKIRDIVWQRARRKTLMFLVIMVNLGVVVYLGMVHQRGVIDVNLKIVELVKHEPQTYSIHYLLGCHSTPLLSHLHTPPIHFETWALDCSPECRSNPKVECESEAFLKDPAEFAEHTYFHCSDFEEGTCVTDLRLFYPDFLVTKSEYLPKMQSRLATMGMKEVARFTNGVKGIRFPDGGILGPESCNLKNGQERKHSNPTKYSFLCLDEIVLFESKIVKPRY